MQIALQIGNVSPVLRATYSVPSQEELRETLEQGDVNER